jgi:hypothetical protein
MQMARRSLAAVPALLAASVVSLMSMPAGAVGMHVTISAEQLNARGIGSATAGFWLNDAPLPSVAEQSVLLGVGDVLRVELETTALHESGVSNSYDYMVAMDFILDDGAAAAVVQSRFSGIADASPVTAQGSAGSEIVCDFVNDGCSAPSLPGSFAFTSGVISSTLDILPNQVTVNNVTTETGRVGGEESLDLLTTLILDRSLGSPEARASFQASALAIFEASAYGAGTFELTVSELTPIPEPTVALMMLTGLLLLAETRRRVNDQ